MRRLISLVLAICLLGAIWPAGAEDLNEEPDSSTESAQEVMPVEMIPGAGYAFDFTIRLHPEAFSGEQREKMEGYADLFRALRFKGTYTWALEAQKFDLRLAVIPVNYAAGRIDFSLYGAEDSMIFSSSLLGDQKISLSLFSMLGFCAKMSEHLGLPLHYLALLYPYTWKYSLRLILENCDYVFSHRDENGVISEELMQYLWDCLSFRLNNDEPFNILVDALCKDSESEEAFRAVIAEIPDYIVKQVAQGKATQVISEPGSTVWRTAGGDVYQEEISEPGRKMNLSLPWMQTGYLPVFSLETFRENRSLSGWLRAQLLGAEDRQDIVNLEASLISFPQSWPVDCYSLLSVNLTGGLLPNAGFSCYLSGEQNGHVRMEVRKPTVELEPGEIMLTLEGEILPLTGDVQVEEFSFRDYKGALDLFISNDAAINAVIPELVRPLLQGMLQFLVGVPTSSCQAVMDSLTEMGVFEVLLGQ